MAYTNPNPCGHSYNSIPIKPSSVPLRSVAPQSANQQPSRKAHLVHAEANNWVAFPPLPEAALHPFSSAVQFVSTTLKPLTEPSIAYPSGPLPNHLSRANSLLSSSSSSSSRINHLSASHVPRGSSFSSNAALKRSRTTTSSSHPTSISRKRSKSDFGSTSYHRPGSTQQPTHPNIRPLIPSGKTQEFGSSSSLAHLNAPRSTRQRSRTPDPHTPALLIRQKQRLSETSTQGSGLRKNSTTSPYPQYMNAAAVRSSSSLKSSASVTSIGTLYPSRSRAHSQLNPLVSGVQDEDSQVGPVRRTYLGGVGVYLNNPQDQEDENSQDEDDSPGGSPEGHHRPKPQLTINVGLCKNAPESSKNSGNWYNRLLLSPLSSAGSSVYSFIMNGSSPLVPSDDPAQSQDHEDCAAEEPLHPAASSTKTSTSWKQSFRRQK